MKYTRCGYADAKLVGLGLGSGVLQECVRGGYDGELGRTNLLVTGAGRMTITLHIISHNVIK